MAIFHSPAGKQGSYELRPKNKEKADRIPRIWQKKIGKRL
jgi:hypothetical protein